MSVPTAAPHLVAGAPSAERGDRCPPVHNVTLIADVLTDWGVLAAGAEFPATVGVGHREVTLHLSAVIAAGQPRGFSVDVDHSVVQGGNRTRAVMVDRRKYFEEYWHRRDVGDSHEQSIHYLVESYGTTAGNLWRWGFGAYAGIAAQDPYPASDPGNAQISAAEAAVVAVLLGVRRPRSQPVQHGPSTVAACGIGADSGTDIRTGGERSGRVGPTASAA